MTAYHQESNLQVYFIVEKDFLRLPTNYAV